jgi:diguanylate cyclase (GGDEF)-like protein
MTKPAGRFGATIVAALMLSTAAVRADAGPIRFDRLTIDEGLSQSTVLSILQDSRGFIWVGTEDGLNRYDGHGFRVYKHDPADPESLGHDAVWAIAEDEAGNLWLGTEGGGLAMWDRARDRFVRYGTDRGLTSPYVRAVHVSAAGEVWIGTRDAGLRRLDPVSGTVIEYRADPDNPSALIDNRIFALQTDREGRLWVGTDAGLCRVEPDDGRFDCFAPDPSDPTSISDGRIRAIFEQRSGTLWIGTYGGGLNRLDRSAGAFESFRNDPADAASLSHDRIRAILEDDDGRLWVGTSGGLDLLNRDGDGFTHYRHEPSDPTSLSDNSIMSLQQDRGGVLWVGTRTGGLHKWNPRSWQFGHYATSGPSQDGLSNNNVMGFLEDDAGLWIATFGGGLNLMDRTSGQVRHFRHDPQEPQSLSSDRVTTLLRDGQDALWIGTLDGGLNRFDAATGEFQAFRHDETRPDSLGADGITSILEDSGGRLWVGTFGGGLNRMDRDSGTFVRYRRKPSDASSLSGDRVTSLVEDARGRLWVGTDGGGLNLLDPETESFVRFRHDPGDRASLAADTLFALHIDARDTLWVGTRGNGLGKLLHASRADGGAAFKNYSEREADLWLATNHGLSRFDPRAATFHNYHVHDGLQSNEFHFGSSYRSPAGELFFGGVNGFNAFFSDRLQHDAPAPPVVLTSFLKLNKPVAGLGPPSEMAKIDLGYDDDDVTFEFAALDYSAPESNVYAYRLEGFDREWIEVGNIHRVTYTNLDPGDYVFRVRAANDDGVWNEAGLAVPIRVEAPPWLSPWAYILYTLILGSVILNFVGAQQRKLNREAAYSRRLEEDVQARTHELAQHATELEKLNGRLTKASVTDSLTGLANRRYLLEYLEREVSLVRRRHASPATSGKREDNVDLVFMMVDLDNFKTINDTCGHAAGDRVLRQLSRILEGACRTSDILIRWGGDEFLVVGRDSDQASLERLAERIRERIEAHTFDLDDGRVAHATCSIGFACYPFMRSRIDALSWEQVISVADRALYMAKRTGRNAWVGFTSTATTPVQGVLAKILYAPGELARAGLVEVRTSIAEDLCWDSPEPHQVALRLGASVPVPVPESEEDHVPA